MTPTLHPLPTERPRPERATGADLIVESLLRNGVELIFGYPGGAILPLYDALHGARDQLRHILVRHEQGAVHAAQGYARASGRCGVALGTSGPGATNLITGLLDAYMDSTPVVAFGGQVPLALIGNDAFQEADMMGLTAGCTKHNFQPRRAHELPAIIDEAFHIATTGRPGPVYIDLAKDVQLELAEAGATGGIDLPFYVPRPALDRSAIDAARGLIAAAQRPFMVIGHGAIHAEAAAPLLALAERLDLPVGTTIMAKGLFDERHPNSVGCVGMHGRRVANYAVTECDLLLAFGCRFSDRITGETKSFARGKHIIHVDIDRYELGKNVPAHVGIHADAKDAAEALLQAFEGFAPNWTGWTNKVRGQRKICNSCIPDQKDDALLPKQVINLLNSALEDDDIVTTGVGQHQMFASHYLYRRQPRTFITSGGAGTMGFGLPAAIGAALACPDRTVWNVDGDGSFQMNVQELGTLLESGAKVITVLLDNAYLGMVRQWQDLYFDKRYAGVDLTINPEFVKLAEAYGLEGHFADDPASLKDALAAARKSERSSLIHVAVSREANILPMIPPGGKVSEFFGYCIEKPGRFFTDAEMARIDTEDDQ